MSENKRTCLYEKHVALGAQISPFGGFEMPIQYTNITDEHLAVRHHCGIFDVSHMGEVRISGPEAKKFVQHIFTNDVNGVPAGKALYGMMLYPNGGVVDDVLVYCEGHDVFFFCINAANIEKDVEWMLNQSLRFSVKVKNLSDYYAQVAIQGPESEENVERLLDIPCKDLDFYTFKKVQTQGEEIIISRTGYTGEDGFEIFGSSTYINMVWDKMIANGIKPCGLGCRDTLRFEVGLPLYGDELSADITPIEAGLGIFVKTNKEEFIGKDIIVSQKADGVSQKLVGIELNNDDKAIPRHGYEIMKDGTVIGSVTTGYRTIMTDKSVCMALIDAKYKTLGTQVQVMIHRKSHEGTVVAKKFYQKSYKK